MSPRWQTCSFVACTRGVIRGVRRSFLSLHDRRFMSQAGRTRYFARSATWARSARRGEEKLFPSSRATREISRSPHLAHKAPVMQARVFCATRETHEGKEKEKIHYFSFCLPLRDLRAAPLATSLGIIVHVLRWMTFPWRPRSITFLCLLYCYLRWVLSS